MPFARRSFNSFYFCKYNILQFLEVYLLLLLLSVLFGIDPIHFGVIITINMELGMLTPPVGLNLFVASGITGESIKEVVKSVMPWFFVLLLGLILITYIPQISLWLPNTMMK